MQGYLSNSYRSNGIICLIEDGGNDYRVVTRSLLKREIKPRYLAYSITKIFTFCQKIQQR
jgi:hypothetical protein